MLSRLAASLLLALPLLPAFAATAPTSSGPKPFDWPQWRGPNRDDVCKETGLLQTWPADGPPVVWKRKDLGGGYTTPSVAAGRVIGMSYRGNDEVVWALDEATGAPLWATALGPKPDAYTNDGPRSTPTVDGDRLYAVGVGGTLACLESATGRVVWRKSFPKDFHGHMMTGWGYSESPLVDGDKLICTPGADDAALAALDKKTGKVLWTATVPAGGGSGYASVMPAEVGGVRMYVNWLKTKLVGVAAKDGKLLWEYDAIANPTANIPTVIVRGEYVFASSGYGEGGSALLKLVPATGGVTAQQVYHLGATKLQNHHGGMVLVGDHLYFGHGHEKGDPVCVEFLTGKVVWKQTHPPGHGSAGVVYADGNLVFRWQDGTVGLIAATPAGYQLKGSFKQTDRSAAEAWSHPVIANGRLYLRDQDVLICYDVKK
jgi:outer membrane protein assembly factor BamB